MRLLPVLFSLFAAASAVGFSYTNDTFLLNGKPYVILGGQMDPQRIPHTLWRDRLAKARAMGLNTILSYIYWDQLEPKQGEWNNQGNNDIAKYFRIAQQEGLNIILRPGPYVCAEHEWGGFPAWLSAVPGMEVRTNNDPFLAAAKSYLNQLGKDVAPLLVTKGGPILMTQIENEYGSYGSNHEYIAALRDMMYEAFPGVPLYTNDGPTKEMMEGGQIPGALAITDGSNPKEGMAAQEEYVTEPSSMGPYMDGEYYITWLDHWSTEETHNTNSGNSAAIKKNQKDLEWILNNNGSFAIYMFHGGTNWGFQNGANWESKVQPVSTNYDYGAPLDETGRRTDIYDALRETLRPWQGPEGLPPLVEQTPLIEVPSFSVKPAMGLFDSLPKPVRKSHPVNMEEVGQGYGFTLYRHVATSEVSGNVQPGDMPRDRVIVYVNNKRKGVIDGTYETPKKVSISLKADDVLDLLVENLGRVNYGPQIPDQRKGIVGNVAVNDNVLNDWEIYSLGLEDVSIQGGGKAPEPSSDSAPIFYTGSFDVENPGDTFLELPGWVKGVLWVNGVNVGRYWTIGPQQSLYVPGTYLKKKNNEVIVLALEPTGDEGELRGTKTRTWENKPDPDFQG